MDHQVMCCVNKKQKGVLQVTTTDLIKNGSLVSVTMFSDADIKLRRIYINNNLIIRVM